MSRLEVREVPFRNGYTWARLTIPDRLALGAHPLFVLHGGPGMAHNYVRNIEAVADLTHRLVIHYDQYGCGLSTHEPDAARSFWAPQLFVDEFHNLRTALQIHNYHVIGQSWGGMLAAEIAARRPPGLQALCISNSPAAMELWIAAANELRTQLPAEVQETLNRHEQAQTYHDPDYLDAVRVFYENYVYRTDGVPRDFAESEAQEAADPTVYETMNGPNEFSVIGTLRNWDIRPDLPKVTAPTLVISADHDEATPPTWQPYLDLIPDSRAHVFDNGSHCTHLEHPQEYMQVLGEFITNYDSALGSQDQ